MDAKQEVREFLTTRRAKLTPQQAGITAGSNRRVPGLRRAEVAMLADVSVEYYARLERGNLGGVSDSVLDAIARALQLDDAEREHLTRLAALANHSPQVRRARAKAFTPRPSLQRVLDAMSDVPAFVRNGRMDVVAANRLAEALYSDAYASSAARRPVNLALFTFLDARARDFYPDWDGAAEITVAILRTEAGRVPYDKDLHDLVGELSTRSPEFRALWGRHDVRRHATGVKTFHHDVVGDLTLAYEGMELAGDPGLQLTVYTAEPASPTHERLALLASWAATQDQAATRDLPGTIRTEADRA
jgi:transcriptional regulator with XRE-family HTH domain